MDEKGREGEDSKMDCFKRKTYGKEVQKSQENSLQRPCPCPCPSTNRLMASQSSNKGCSQFYSHVIEIPADKVGYVVGRNRATIGRLEHSSGAWIKIESGPCTPGTNRRVHLDGTREQIVSAIQQITDMIDRCPPRRFNPKPDHHLRDPSYYGPINPLRMPAPSYPGMPLVSSQGSCTAPPLHHIRSEAGDEASSSAIHASTSRKRQRND